MSFVSLSVKKDLTLKGYDIVGSIRITTLSAYQNADGSEQGTGKEKTYGYSSDDRIIVGLFTINETFQDPVKCKKLEIRDIEAHTQG